MLATIFAAFFNIYLLAVGITIAGILILGTVVFVNNRKSSTGRAFLFLSIVTVLYSATNYISYQVSTPVVTLWILRLTIFFAVWHAFSFLHFASVFPQEKASYSRAYRWFFLPLAIIVSILTLTRLIFSGVEVQGTVGTVSQAVLGPLIPLF